MLLINSCTDARCSISRISGTPLLSCCRCSLHRVMPPGVNIAPKTYPIAGNLLDIIHGTFFSICSFYPAPAVIAPPPLNADVLPLQNRTRSTATCQMTSAAPISASARACRKCLAPRSAMQRMLTEWWPALALRRATRYFSGTCSLAWLSRGLGGWRACVVGGAADQSIGQGGISLLHVLVASSSFAECNNIYRCLYG